MRLVFKGRAIGRIHGKTRLVYTDYRKNQMLFIPLSLITNEVRTGSDVTDLELSFDVPDWFYEKNKERLELWKIQKNQHYL